MVVAGQLLAMTGIERLFLTVGKVVIDPGVAQQGGRGLVIAGQSPDGRFVETIELPGHPWFVAVQFHPEFRSKPLSPHPLFADFVRASYAHNAETRAQATSAVS